MKLVRISADGTPDAPLQLPEVTLEVIVAYVKLYQMVGCISPWQGYIALANSSCVGTCGFKGPPLDGRVEIAYFTFPGNEGKGFATQMARLLVELARTTDPGLIVAAQTLPNESASTTILRKLGFVNMATINHPEDGEVWEWRLRQLS